jgi:hypothetical protein
MTATVATRHFRARLRPRPADIAGPHRDRAPWLLGLAALVVYGTASWWGLPHASSALTIHGWDVDGVGGIGVLSELHSLLVKPAPDWYTAYPVLHYLVVAVLYGPYMVYLKLTGGLGAPTGTYPFGLADPVGALRALALIARCLTVGMAAGVVVATYLTARELWDRRAGVLAALFVMLLGPMVFYARTTNLDIPTRFWSAFAALVAVRALRTELTVRRALLLGALAALSVATKDQSYGAWVLGLGYVALRCVKDGEAPPARRWRTALVLLGAAAGVYVLASGIPLWPGRFAAHVHFLLGFNRTFFNLQHANALTTFRPSTPAGYLALLGDVLLACDAALGPVLVLAGAAGLGVAWRRTPESRVLAWLALGFVLLTILPIHHMQYRYALMPASVLACFAAYLVSEGLRHPRLRLGALLVLVAGLGWQLLGAVDLTYQMLFDARYAAGTWLGGHVVPGDRIGYFGAAHQLPPIPRGVLPVTLDRLPAPEQALRRGLVEWVVVAPDYFSDTAREHSLFLPDSTYRRLRDGSLGYRRVASFATPPLSGRALPYLPYVNPRVQLFQRVRARSD